MSTAEQGTANGILASTLGDVRDRVTRIELLQTSTIEALRRLELKVEASVSAKDIADGIERYSLHQDAMRAQVIADHEKTLHLWSSYERDAEGDATRRAEHIAMWTVFSGVRFNLRLIQSALALNLIGLAVMALKVFWRIGP